MTPQTVNAYYHPLRNEIVFPAAILQPPFFNEHADDAVNYGGIGAVIGHEIGHGFDDQGSTCDGDGRLQNWWTDADRAAFEERTKVLIAQYDALSPAQTPDMHVNGALTIGENIGDLGGLSIAFLAHRIAQGDERARRSSTASPPSSGSSCPGPRCGRRKGARRARTPAPRDRPALAGRVPLQPDRAQPGRLLRGVRRGRGRPALARAGAAGQHLVRPSAAPAPPWRWTVVGIDDLAAQVREALGPDRPAVVAVDGHSSSGKSSLAPRLAAALPSAAVLHTRRPRLEPRRLHLGRAVP